MQGHCDLAGSIDDDLGAADPATIEINVRAKHRIDVGGINTNNRFTGNRLTEGAEAEQVAAKLGQAMPDHHDITTTPRTESRRPEMNYRQVNSSMLDAVAYDDTLSTLRVRFKNGTQYEYSGVPAAVYRGLLTETSSAIYFHVHVSEAGYWCRRLP